MLVYGFPYIACCASVTIAIEIQDGGRRADSTDTHGAEGWQQSAGVATAVDEDPVRFQREKARLQTKRKIGTITQKLADSGNKAA